MDEEKEKLAALRQGIIKDGIRYYPEAKLLGNKKHGIGWSEALASAISEGIPQGQFGSLEDVRFAVEKGAELGLDQIGFFDLPSDHTSFVAMPDGSIVTASRILVKVYSNGKVHSYPLP